MQRWRVAHRWQPWRALRSPTIGLAGFALAGAGLYWQGITRQYPLAKGLAGTHRTWPALVDLSLRAGWTHAGVYTLLIIGYMLALRLAAQVPSHKAVPAMGVVVAGWLLCSASLLPAYPGESLDIFDYLVRGRMQVMFGVSPLATTPDAFPDVPFYSYATWKGWVDAYGPLWEGTSGMVARAVSVFTRSTLPDYVLGYRLLAITMAGLCGGLIVRIVGRAAPRLTVVALATWLWNPLLLIATALGGHNDGMMLVLMLLALLCVQREHWLLGLLMLGLAAHVKIMALLLLPALLLGLVRRRGWRRAFGIALATLILLLPLSWALYEPFGGWQTLPRMLRERAILTYNSPANIVFDVLYRVRHWPVTPARQAAIRGSTLLFLLVAAALMLSFWWQTRTRPADDATLWRVGIAITMAYLLVGCFWFQEWYVMWVLVLAALLPGSTFTLRGLPLFSLGALLSNISTEFLNQDPLRRFTPLEVDAIMVTVLWAPLLGALILPILWRIVQGRPTSGRAMPNTLGAADPPT